MANYDIYNRYDTQVVLKVIENKKETEIIIQPKATVKVRDMEILPSSLKKYPKLHVKNLDEAPKAKVVAPTKKATQPTASVPVATTASASASTSVVEKDVKDMS